MSLHVHADDTQLYCCFKPKSDLSREAAIKCAEACVDDIRNWMDTAKLKLNTDKTELLVISSPHNKPGVSDVTVRVGDVAVVSSDTCRNLGVIFDRTLSMKSHVTTLCRSAYYQLRNIGTVRRYLTKDACAQLIQAFVTSKK